MPKDNSKVEPEAQAPDAPEAIDNRGTVRVTNTVYVDRTVSEEVRPEIAIAESRSELGNGTILVSYDAADEAAPKAAE